MDFIRARTEEQIASRKKEIISACDILYSRYGYEGVHFKAISAVTSCKRSTIYSYYKTKDEVLLDLLKREMLAWKSAMEKEINASDSMTKEQFSAFLAESTAARHKMLRLLSILTTCIENQCRLEKVACFKKDCGDAFTVIRESLEKYFPSAAACEKTFFMIMFSAYIHGLYTLAYPTQKQIDAMKLAGREYVPVDFRATLYKAVLLLLADW